MSSLKRKKKINFEKYGTQTRRSFFCVTYEEMFNWDFSFSQYPNFSTNSQYYLSLLL